MLTKWMGFLALVLLATSSSGSGIDTNPLNIFQPITIKVDGRFPLGDQLDILFVVDDSGSMDVHQKNLAQHVDVIAEKLAKVEVDYHFGVLAMTSKKKDSGILLGNPRYLSLADQPVVEDFKKRLLLGTIGDWSETGFGPLRNALSEPLVSRVNSGFYRPNARLGIVFVTDAVDQSPISFWKISDFLMQLKREDMSKIVTSALIVPSNVKDCRRDDGSKRPTKYEEMIRIFKGKVYNICKTDKATVSDITDRMVAGLNKQKYEPGRALKDIDLHVKPSLKSLKVRFGSQVIPQQTTTEFGWSFDEKTNRLSISGDVKWERQPYGTMIEITFYPEKAKTPNLH